MTEEDTKELAEIVRHELHSLEDSRLKEVEFILVVLGIVLCVACVCFGFDPWAPLPPLAAEIVRAKR